MEVVEERIGTGCQRANIEDCTLPRRHHLLAIELGTFKLGSYLACVLDPQLKLHAGLDVQGTRLEPIVVNCNRISGFLRLQHGSAHGQNDRSSDDAKNSSASKRHIEPQRNAHPELRRCSKSHLLESTFMF